MGLLKNLFQKHGINTDRERMRIRQASLTGITTLVVKGISTIAGLVSIPFTAQYLGTERFGVWLILSTLLNWISIADLGLSNSLINTLATADGQEDRKTSKEAVSSAFWLMLALAVVLAVLFIIIHPLVPWSQVFNVSSALAKKDIEEATFVCLILFVIRLPLSIPGRIYGSYQEGYFYQLWSGLSSLLSVIALVAAIHAQANLLLLIAAFFGTLLLGDVFSAIHLFGFQRQWLKPKLKYFSWQQSRWLLKTGLQFWSAQISAILIFQTDLIIVAQMFGASTVASYGVTLRLFSIIGYVSSSFTLPLWPAYSEALARKDFLWIIQIFKRSVILSFIWSLTTGILVAKFASPIVKAWVNPNITLEQNLILAMLFTTVLTSIAQCVASLINGLGEIHLQAIVAPISAITNLFLSVFLGSLMGVSGVTWATGICMMLFSLGVIGGDILKKLKKMRTVSMFLIVKK